MIYVYLSELLLYLCFSVLAGAFISQLVPNDLKPTIVIHKRWIQLSIIGVMLFSAAPLFRLIDVFYANQSKFTAIFNIIGKFEVGKAWAVMAAVALLFLLFVTFFPVNNKTTIISFVFLLALVLTVGWTSHSASIANMNGFTFHSLHFVAVIVWAGILFVVSWFAKDSRNWIEFLDWFSSIALTCVMLIIGSGIYLMQFVLDPSEYANAWTIPYGQSLLIKHILIVPVLIFAFINGVWMKRMIVRQKNVNPLPWVRIESIILLLVFTATGVLGQQETPLHIEDTLQRNGYSPLFEFFYGEPFSFFMNVGFEFGPINILLFVLAALFVFMVFYAFKMKSSIIALVMGLLSALCLYLGLMTGIY